MESSRSEKRFLTPLKITIFWTTCAKLGPPLSMAKTIFFAKIKPDHKLSKKFYFIKIYVLAELLKCFSILYDAFLLKCVISSNNRFVILVKYHVLFILGKCLMNS